MQALGAAEVGKATAAEGVRASGRGRFFPGSSPRGSGWDRDGDLRTCGYIDKTSRRPLIGYDASAFSGVLWGFDVCGC